jgi:methylmalonyl-CoA mutase
MKPEPPAVPGATVLKPVYTSADLEGVPHLDSQPGEAPFLRGAHRTMYAGRPWTIRQYAGFASAEASNAFFHTSLRNGAQGLSLAFHLPTHRGYDSDHPAAGADVGKAGVAIDSVEDMKRLFHGIDLGTISVSMTMSGAVLPVLACFIVAAQESGVAPAALTGTIQNDILKEFMVRNTYIHGPQASLRIATDVSTYLMQALPRFNLMSVSGYHLQEAGAGAALELALTMANADTYLERLIAAGAGIGRACERISFFFGVGRDFYQEIAKLRAARVLWSEIAAARGCSSARGQALRMHCQTSGWTLSAREPHNNIVRTTVQALAAVFGGTQSLHTNSYDEAIALPGDEAARLALTTQLVLQHEHGLCDVADPWAGSYMMERLTHDIATAARQVLAQIRDMGGVVAALDSGWIAGAIDSAALETQARIDSGRHVIVGQNRFAGNPGAQDCRMIDGAAVLAQQRQRLQQLRARRDNHAVTGALDALAACARDGGGNLLAATIEAIRVRATIGECSAALERTWPRHQAQARYVGRVFQQARGDDVNWLASCEAVRRCTARLGRAPRLLLAKLGQDGHDRGAKAVAGALADAGFDVVLSELFQTAAAVAQQADAANADIIGVSSLAGGHLALLRELSEQLRQRGIGRLPLVAGGVIPDADHEALHACGVAHVFTSGTSMDDVIAALLALL